MKRFSIILACISILTIFSVSVSSACTNYLVTRGASTDGSNILTYAADSHVLYGELYFRPAADWPAGSMIDIFDWDTGVFLGKIPQVAHTYSVVGNVNEYQLAIAESTWGGIKQLSQQEGSMLDYGSLIYLALQRCKTAREAIKLMTNLVDEYGYFSSGESFSIADKNEIWILELIGKGNGEKGAVWVARMIPDGYVSGHANQSRITTFPLEGKTSISSDDIDKIFNKNITTVYAKDVISFAKQKNLYAKDGKNKHFSFAAAYGPVSFGGARYCDIRVWTFFNSVNNDMQKHFDYVKGNVTYDKKGIANNRMPLWIKPNNKIDVLDVMDFMRDHLEGTELDMSKDLGAGPFGVPYRWRPLTWKADGHTYLNERTTATQQTGFSFVAQLRNWLPDTIGAINWFSVDDADSAVYFPMYASSTRVPESYAVGNGSMMEFSKSAFWIFNQVSNFSYTRYSDIHPEIRKKQKDLEKKYKIFSGAIDKAALDLIKNDPKTAREFITDFSCNQGDNLTKEWTKFYAHLFTKFMDGNIKTKNGNMQNPNVKQPGYGERYYRNVAKSTGDQLRTKGKSGH